MFWDKWIPHKYLVKSEVFVVEAYLEDQQTEYHFTHLKNSNNKITMLDAVTSNELQLPAFVVKKKIPLVLIINGKGVIIKKVDLKEESGKSLDEIIVANLPALNSNEFYIQLYRQENETGFISLCRRNIVDKLLEQFSQQGYEIADLFIGSPSAIGLQPLWSKFNTLELSHQRIELTNGFLDLINTETSTDDKPLIIEDIVLNKNYVLGFASGLTYFMQRKLAESSTSFLNALSIKHKENNQFKFLAVIAVSLAFVLALTNLFFYFSFFDKNNKLESELAVYQGKYEQVNQLLNNYQKNKDLIEDAGVLGKNKLSEYADKIGKTLPDELTLTELYFNPKEDKDENEDSLVTFQTKQLILRGNCEKSFIVNEWLSVLKMQKFIKDVNLEKFVYNNKAAVPNFEIKLMTE